MSIKKFTRTTPTTAQTKVEAVKRSAFAMFAIRPGAFIGGMFGPSQSIKFGTPEEDAAAAEAAQVEKVAAKVAEIVGKQINGLSAGLRKLETDFKTGTGKKTESEPEELTLKQQLANLQKERETERKQKLTSQRNEGINAAISAKNITGESALDLRARLQMDHGEHIKVDGDVVVYEDPKTGEKFSIDEFLEKSFLTGARKDRYLASPNKQAGKFEKSTNRVDGDRPFYSQLSPEVRGKMSASERDAYVAEDRKRN